MPTITVKNASGVDVDLEVPSSPGRASAATSRPVVLSTEDKAALDALATSLETIELGATTLAALENITVELGVTSLAALESVTATGPLTDAQLRNSAVPVSLAAAETVIGAVAGLAEVVEVTLTLDTAAYAAGDVLAATQTLADAVRINGGRAILQSLTVIDEDDQGQAFDLVFLSANQSLGAEKAAPSIGDAGARDVLGSVAVAAGDFIDLGGVRIASLRNVGLLLEAAAGSRDLFIAAISRGTGTYSASGLRLRLGLLLS